MQLKRVAEAKLPTPWGDFLMVGFAADERDFTLCADMFKLLGVNEVRLLTNNPKKVEILTEAGINIIERVPLIVGRNPNNEHYLDTKAEKMGHLLNK